MTSARGARLRVIGAGRMGLALGSELLDSGWARAVVWHGRSPQAPEHPVFARQGAHYRSGAVLPEPPDAILLTVPDAAIGEAAAALRPLELKGVSVLHTSGALASDLLLPLVPAGSAVGSLHPLVSIADPVADAPRLRGAFYAVEGDALARQTASSIVAALGGRQLTIPAGGKALYHAAAVTASNHLVALLASAERLLSEAGLEGPEAREALTRLAAGSVANVARSSPAEALTGPISRGDAPTVELHLRQLSPADRELYCGLAREALTLAEERGLGAEAAARIAELLNSFST